MEYENGLPVMVGNRLLMQYKKDDPNVWEHEDYDLAAKSEGFEAKWGELVKIYIKLCKEKYTRELNTASEKFIKCMQDDRITGSWMAITDHLQWAKDNKLYVWATK